MTSPSSHPPADPKDPVCAVPHRPEPPGTFEEVRRGVAAAIPIIIGCLPLGFILGVEAGRKGMSPFTAWLMCSMNFAGGSEFAAVALWSTVPPMLVVWLTTWLINSRHIVMGASLSLSTKALSARTHLLVWFLMCDELWALSSADVKRRSKAGWPASRCFSLPFYLGAGLSFWSTWAASAALGAVLGSDLGDMTHWGIQMAFPATFISLLGMVWPGRHKAHPIVISAVVAAATSPFLPSHWCVLAATLSGLAWVWFTTPDQNKTEEQNKSEKPKSREEAQ